MALATFFLLVGWAIAGCEGDAKRFSDAVIASQQGITALQISPETSTLNPGDTLQLSSLGVDADANTIDLTTTSQWSAADPAVASIDELGIVSAIANGSTTVTAGFASLSASATIVVNQASMLSLEISAPASIDLCRPAELQLTGLYSDNSTRPVSKDISWFVDGVAATSNRIILTQARPIVIEARSAAGPSAVRSFNVNDNLTSISLKPASLTLSIDSSSSGIIATGTYPDAAVDITDAVSWSSSDSNISVDSSGNIGALDSGSATVTVSCGGIEATLPVTVSVDGAPTALEINNGDSLIANVGSEVDLTLDAILSDGSRQDVTADAVWSIDQQDFGLQVVITQNNDNVTVSASNAGTAYIQASYEGKEEVVKITFQ